MLRLKKSSYSLFLSLAGGGESQFNPCQLANPGLGSESSLKARRRKKEKETIFFRPLLFLFFGVLGVKSEAAEKRKKKKKKK